MSYTGAERLPSSLHRVQMGTTASSYAPLMPDRNNQGNNTKDGTVYNWVLENNPDLLCIVLGKYSPKRPITRTIEEIAHFLDESPQNQEPLKNRRDVLLHMTETHSDKADRRSQIVKLLGIRPNAVQSYINAIDEDGLAVLLETTEKRFELLWQDDN